MASAGHVMDQVYVARVAGTDVTHLAAYVDHVDGELRAVCLISTDPQPFALLRASEGERLVWCGDCEAYRHYLAADSLLRSVDADVIPLDPSTRPRGRVRLPDPRTA